MADDRELLRRYVESHSEEAFAELVRRHVDLVYSAALRRVGDDAHLAQDVTQAVFTTFARKAPTLLYHPVLGGWFHRCTQFIAADAVRKQRRQVRCEQIAEAMNPQFSPPDSAETRWQELRPVIDSLLDQLNNTDRDAIILRFFEARSFSDIGATLRMTEDAARMRVNRAMDRLRALFARRDIVSSAGAIGIALANHATTAAPAALAGTATATALANVAAIKMGAVAVFLAMNKLKIGIVGAIVIAGASTAVVDVRANRALRAELQPGGISGRVEEETVWRLQQENRRLAALAKEAGERDPRLSELVRVRNRIAALKARPDGVVDDEFRVPSNRGRATPAEAIETFCWAIDQNDLDLVAPFIRFGDDTPENRATFMASFSETVRARYGTPERLCAAAFFGVGRPLEPDAGRNGIQVVSVQEDHLPDQVKIQLWWRTSEGKEFGGRETYYRYADGWASKPLSLRSETLVANVKPRLDPASGDWIPPAAGKR